MRTLGSHGFAGRLSKRLRPHFKIPFLAEKGAGIRSNVTTTFNPTAGTDKWVRDHGGILRYVDDQKIPIHGARVVTNGLSTSANAINGATATDQGGGEWLIEGLTTGTGPRFNKGAFSGESNQYRTFTGRIQVKAGSVDDIGKNILVRVTSASGSSGTPAISATITLTSSYQSVAVGTYDGVSGGLGAALWVYGAPSDNASSVIVKEWAVYEVSGAAVTTCPEWVDYSSTRYFMYENGNTVSGGSIITDTNGARISPSTLRGALLEPALTNNLWPSEDLTTGWGNAWSGGVVALSIDANIRNPSGAYGVYPLTGIDNTTDGVSRAITIAAASTYPIQGFFKNHATNGSTKSRFVVYNTTDNTYWGLELNWSGTTLSSITAVKTGAAGAVPTQTYFESWGNGWYRVGFMLTTVSGTGTTSVILMPDFLNTQKTIYAWGIMQQSASQVYSSYIRTTTAGVSHTGTRMSFTNTGGSVLPINRFWGLYAYRTKHATTGSAILGSGSRIFSMTTSSYIGQQYSTAGTTFQLVKNNTLVNNISPTIEIGDVCIGAFQFSPSAGYTSYHYNKTTDTYQTTNTANNDDLSGTTDIYFGASSAATAVWAYFLRDFTLYLGNVPDIIVKNAMYELAREVTGT